MDVIELVRPGPEHERAAAEYLEEHFAAGERDLHGASLLEKQASYGDWLAFLDKTSDSRTAGPDWVPASTFFAVRQNDGRVVGVINVRHELNAFLRSYGGHIGYGVRPSERRKGYAGEMLRQALEYCRTLGLQEVMLSCDKDNLASAATIRSNGGELEKEFVHTDGKIVQVYWIRIGDV